MADAQNVRILVGDSYVQAIRNSVGSHIYRNLYAEIAGEKVDILRDGDLSCAFFVSSILHQFNLVGGIHATVSGTITDMEKSGWYTSDRPRIGDVILWERQAQVDDEQHKHIGFFVGDDQAISNSYIEKTPVGHHWRFNDSRRVERIYTHDNI